VSYLYPIRLQASLHETIWGGRRLEHEHWKVLPLNNVLIGEAWETEVSTLVLNGPHEGLTLGNLVDEWGAALLGKQAMAIFGKRFPLLAKFIDANAQLSVQVHPNDDYARIHENGKLGKTEFWYILAAEPGAKVIHGFKAPTEQATVEAAIQNVTLDQLLDEVEVKAGDVILVPAGTVHAIGAGILLYELQEYSDVTYRMYDYGRLSASGQPRELHVSPSLAVSIYRPSPAIKMHPVKVAETNEYEDTCLVACKYFLTHELRLKQGGSVVGTTGASCIILSSLSADARIYYSEKLELNEPISKGQSVVLPAELGAFRIEGSGSLLLSYVPSSDDAAWRAWDEQNTASILR
jgi:mannose-6-phosphate isomerase